jgi:hypothetical protein
VTLVCAASAHHSYRVYGVKLRSEIPLPLTVDSSEGEDFLGDVTFVVGVDEDFSDVPQSWTSAATFVCENVIGRGTYVRWPCLYEFMIVGDGSRVSCRPLAGCDVSVFQNFLLGQVVALALVKQGIEPLHAAAVDVDGAAVALLGDCGFGKSTLLASFAQAGYRALTDDMLIVDTRDGRLHAVPGTGRVKLMPDSAERFANGNEGAALTPFTAKRAFPLDVSMHQRERMPLRVLYVLPTPNEREEAASIDVHPVSRAEAVHELVKNTFSTQLFDRSRLVRQFDHATNVAARVDAFRLQYPAGLDCVPAVRQTIVEHARGIAGQARYFMERT